MSKENQIKAALAYAGMSQRSVAVVLGMTPSNFNQKLHRDSFTEDELQKIAIAMGAEFCPCSFIFPNGWKV